MHKQKYAFLYLVNECVLSFYMTYSTVINPLTTDQAYMSHWSTLYSIPTTFKNLSLSYTYNAIFSREIYQKKVL